ncbi:MAG: transposase [Caulobacteraceae bacterium]
MRVRHSKETDVKKSRSSTRRRIYWRAARAEAGSPTAEVSSARVSARNLLSWWKAKYSGMSVSDAQKLKTLEDENRRLKKLLAESMLDVSATGISGKKLIGPRRAGRPCSAWRSAASHGGVPAGWSGRSEADAPHA